MLDSNHIYVWRQQLPNDLHTRVSSGLLSLSLLVTEHCISSSLAAESGRPTAAGACDITDCTAPDLLLGGR